MKKAVQIGWYGPTHDGWGWILEHFRDAVVLRKQDIPAWISDHTQSSGQDHQQQAASLIFASDSRTDATTDLIRSLDLPEFSLGERASSERESGERPPPLKLPWCFLMGTDWSGHRRTQQLPDGWNTFYWYELYDRLLPWLGQLENSTEDAFESTDSISVQGTARKPNVRVQRWIDSVMLRKGLQANPRTKPIFALVVVDQAETQQLWVEALGRHQVQTVCATPDKMDFWVEPDWVFIDLAKPPLDNSDYGIESVGRDTPTVAALDRLVAQFPNSVKVVIDAFPRWHTWRLLHSKGADLMVAKPCSVEGLIDTLKLMH